MAYASKFQAYGDQILAIANRIKTQFPQDWARAHNHQASGEVYIRRVAHAVSVEMPSLQCGLNLKRGNQGLSQDVLCFPNASGARDATGTFPGLEIRDIIASAGTPGASLVWGDVTQATIDKGDPGGWVKPEPVNGEPIPVPPVCPPPFVPGYEDLGGDAWHRAEIGVPLQADMALAGQTLNDGSAVWFSRTIYECLAECLKAGALVDRAPIVKKYRNQWRAILGLPPV